MNDQNRVWKYRRKHTNIFLLPQGCLFESIFISNVDVHTEVPPNNGELLGALLQIKEKLIKA